ncbi:hypothetical protein C0J52_02605 [Blattella germanica]|nr:hypothetical protein C0J52_02605 [Blattella germanica]
MRKYICCTFENLLLSRRFCCRHSRLAFNYVERYSFDAANELHVVLPVVLTHDCQCKRIKAGIGKQEIVYACVNYIYSKLPLINTIGTGDKLENKIREVADDEENCQTSQHMG